MIEIIAEIGSVHDGSLGNAKKLIEVAKFCGANTVKFQMHISEEETLKEALTPNYFTDEKRFEYFNRIAFNEKQWEQLIKHCKKTKINFLCSPFSIKAVKILEKLKVNCYKIPSGEINNIPLLKKVAATNKKCILSTGMSNWSEIDHAIKIFNKNKLVLMQCSSIYPCPPDKSGINVVSEMKNKYSLKLGFSDHTKGIGASIASIVLGATVIEKHLTFSKFMYGSDAKNAMEINEFKNFCKEIREVEIMLKTKINKNNINQYSKMRKIFMKSIVSTRNLKAGKILTFGDLDLKKPGTGILGNNINEVVGKKLIKSIPKDTIIKKSFLK